MPKEIIISVSDDQTRIAIVENGELAELYVENPENVRTIGDIYLARIRRIKPETRAAFVDIGQDQDAFLHFSDLSDNVPALLELAEGRIKEPIARDLPKEPAASDELEAETPEEQLATQRRRDLKRSSGGRRRAKGKPEEPAPSAKSEQKEEAASSEAPRGRRPSHRTPIARPPAEGVPPAPAIIPPGTADSNGEPTVSDEAAPKVDEEGSRQKEVKRQPQRSRRSRSRKRGPATKKEDSSEAQSRKGSSADESVESSPRQGGKQASTTSEPERPRRRRAPSATSANPEPEKAATKGGDEKTLSEQDSDTAESTSVPRLAPSSRFRIDLTGGPASSSRRREEEEEEEERSKSRRSSRRQGRSGRGRRRSSRSGNQKGNGGNDGSAQKASSNGTPPDKHLREGQRIIVKITKEPISTKGPRVSTDISLAGRFLVLVPAADYVAVSKKIESAKERRRLRALARSLLPEGLGLIVRTVADGRDAKALDADLQLLLKKWRRIEDQLRKRPQPPAKLYEDVNMVSSIIRDLFSEDYDRIVIDAPALYKNVKTYVEAVAPQMADKVQLHRKKESVFRTNKIEKDIRAAFESRVPLPGGGSIIIEHTEAMHVIDVNSGRAGRGLTQEQNALKVNLEAAREIAKQLRLRDLGGIICVDFIDMRSNGYRKKLFDELKRAFRQDRAVTKLLPMSDFGVVEITRQRLRPSITTTLDAEDIAEAPEDDVQEEKQERSQPPRSASEVVAHLDRWLMRYRDEVDEKHRKRPILIRVHPFLAAYLQRGIPSLLTRWRLKTRLKMKLDIDEGADPLSFSVRDEKSGKNLTRKYDPARDDG